MICARSAAVLRALRGQLPSLGAERVGRPALSGCSTVDPDRGRDLFFGTVDPGSRVDPSPPGALLRDRTLPRRRHPGSSPLRVVGRRGARPVTHPASMLPTIVSRSGDVGERRRAGRTAHPPDHAATTCVRSSDKVCGALRRRPRIISARAGCFDRVLGGEPGRRFRDACAFGTFPIAAGLLVGHRHVGRRGDHSVGGARPIEWLRLTTSGVIANRAESHTVRVRCNYTDTYWYVPSLLGIGTHPPAFDYALPPFTVLGLTRGLLVVRSSWLAVLEGNRAIAAFETSVEAALKN